ncbi:MAG TPA: relaxase/mobilization nuclease RlxS [Allosphingosinicella sp.]|nr:relaxase/mobilization nuclease RlxS [Allosphingosinicella sp.]
MESEEFEPRLGRIRAPASRRGRRYLYAVLVAAARAGGLKRGKGRRFDGSRIGRGSSVARLLASRDRFAGLRARRAIVKTRLVRLAGKGFAAARAHLRYIQRDGVTRDGEAGRLYSAREDEADGKAFLERCDGDRHQFRFIVSAKDGAEYDDLRPLIRRLMARMEEDLGTSLDWVAADHLDTLHPHTHIMLRGKDELGENLVIAPEYIARGMRERVAELVSLDLGPRTDMEIERRLRLEVDAERLTSVDRSLLRRMDGDRIVSPQGRDMFDHAVRTGRLRKLGALGLAEDLGGGRWRLAADMEPTLRRLGERGDIIRTMQRALSEMGVERAPSERLVYQPEACVDLVGRVIARGLADELRDRHYLIVDGIDGRTHYVGIGSGEATEPLPPGAVVRITARLPAMRPADERIAGIAAASGGRYSVDIHLTHEPAATAAFAEAHVRRLEAIRRSVGGVERAEDGTWSVPADYREVAARHEARLVQSRPVEVELVSAIPLERLPRWEGATWLDRHLASEEREPLRDAGFGREVRSALAVRRLWLVEQELALENAGRFRLRPDAIALLQRRELLRVAGEIARDTGLAFAETGDGSRIEGVLRRRLDLASGRFAMIETGREFSLVPWRPVLARAVGHEVSGMIRRDGGVSWSIGRDRGIGR